MNFFAHVHALPVDVARALIPRVLVMLALIAAVAAPIALDPRPAAAVSCDPCPGTTTDDLNLREDAGTDSEVILVMPAWSELTWHPFTGEQNGYFSVTYDGVDGWAHGDYLWLWPGLGATTDDVNFRAEPSLESQVLDVIPAGAQIQVLGGPDNNYLSVRYQEIAGWVSLDYVIVDGANPNDPPATGEFSVGDLVVVATDFLNYRANPAIDSEVLEVLPAGTEGGILDGPVSVDGYVWYQLGLPGYGPDGATPGWVAAQFLAFAGDGDGSEGFAAGALVQVTTDALNLRADPSLDGDIVSVLSTGASGTVLNSPENADGYTWYPVNFGEDLGVGWVAGEFLGYLGEEGFSHGQVVEVDSFNGLNYRPAPSISESIITVLPDGHQGTIIGGPVFADGYTWWQISAEPYGPGGVTPGWVAGDFLLPV